MRRMLAVATAAALLLSPSLVLSSDHVLDSTTVQARLAEAQKQREADSQAVQRVLASPQAAVAAKAMGTRIERIQTGVVALSDQELHNLAVRAQALRGDPVAGYHDYMIHDLVTVLLIVAVVAIIVSAAD